MGFTPSEMKILPSLVGISILDNLEEENDDFLQGFILGMKDAQASIKPRFNDQSARDYDKLNILNVAQNNIKEADLYFSKLDEERDLSCIAPKILYYRCLEEGTGTKLNNQTKVTIHCKIETPNAFVVTNTWADSQPLEVDLRNAIPGFTWGVRSMKVGETRELFIHPCIGYGIYTTLEKGIYLKARIQLLAIQDNNEEFTQFPPLSCFDFDKDLDTLHKYNFAEVSKIAGYLHGYDIWDHYKQVNYYTLQQVLNYIDQFKSKEDEINYESEANQDLLNRLHWNIYHQESLLKP